MARVRSTKKKDAAYVTSRLLIARGFLKDARNSNLVADPGDIGNPSMSTVINCAIAYSDALTAKLRGEINQDDHQAVVKLLRAALGKALPAKQETSLRALLEQNDEVQYGSRAKTRNDAEKALERLEEFAAWAEQQLAL
ncbi:MAG: HEPN domain-containing protein [Mesorhizobium sp.]|nr:MAG: HEPN domain-containing protein [Mesorhizobium sp.]